ncbi:MAG TPA: ABC transporter ATP-binding protein [Spirochaetia bacterium]|nr:ABC transporter ATP-binding protein [Spirochaetia bacterium]
MEPHAETKLLEAVALTRTFPNGTTAFRDLSFSVRQGEIVGIVGTSGSGKSTLLRVIAGLDRGNGSITLHGKEICGLSPLLGLVFQEPRLMPWLTVKQNASFGLGGKGLRRAERGARALEWLKLVGLEGFEKHYPKECSGGMAQRAALARCLATQPEVLLLDEPFSALDAFTRMQLQDVLVSIWEKFHRTFILVTHDIDEALYLSDRILVLRGQPGVLAAEIRVELPRPRPRGDAQLARLKNDILVILNVNGHTMPAVEYNL